jgi:hypothetical protein
MDVTFFDQVFWSFERESIVVHGRADGKPVRCVVPMEFLTAPFVESLSEGQARSIFDTRRSEIESKLRECIAHGSSNSPSEIILHC